ncbi:MAG TPA: DUF397 domain-containing protein [Actinophytocola sp.]|jgi:hypothetical protein|uniref:DUF397 domain-containing protein n=1 Tax=Actinophytocola sp. TaxID=1872138 RepID=UPI002DF748A6|nr:DUF397 domain-containing protein [Actinophytocola sp.]
MSSSVAERTRRKSSRGNASGACVEIAFPPNITAVRDSKNPAGGTLVLGAAAWKAFCSAVRG